MDLGQVLHLVARDDGIRESLTWVLARDGIPVRAYPDAETFLADGPGEALDYACLLVQADLPGASGVSLVRTLRKRGARAPLIVLTASHDRGLRRRAFAAGATDVLDRTLIEAFLLQRLAQLWPGAERTDVPAATVELADGTRVTFRAMHPADAEIEQEFVRGLSDESRHRRFFSGIRELPPDMLEDFTHPHYPYSYALIATIDENPEGAGRERQIGVARYSPTEDPAIAEFAVTVADEWQRRGIATQLMHVLTTAAALAGIEVLEGLVLEENRGMLEMCRKLGFLPEGDSGDPTIVRVAKPLRGDAPERP